MERTGRVERCNDTLRLEFQSLWTGGLAVSAASPALSRRQRRLNAERSHAALDHRSPMEPLAQLQNLQIAA